MKISRGELGFSWWWGGEGELTGDMGGCSGRDFIRKQPSSISQGVGNILFSLGRPCRELVTGFFNIRLTNIFFDLAIVVKIKSKCGLTCMVCTLIDNEYTSSVFSQTFFFVLFLRVERICKSFFERKVWCLQVAHLHSAAHALSSPSFQLSTNLDRDFFPYLWYCGKKKKTNVA